MNFDAALNELFDRLPEAHGVAVMDPDGIPVVMRPAVPELEVVGAEFANVLREIDHAQRELNYGALSQVSVRATERLLVLTTIIDGYFLLVLTDRSCAGGRVRFLSRLYSERLIPEFVV